MPSAASTSNSQPTETNTPSNLSKSMSSSVSSAFSTSPLATSSSSSISASSSTPAPAQSGSMASSRGLIIGVIIGAAAGSILFLVLLFLVWKCWKRRRSGAGRVPKEQSKQAGYSLGSGEDSNTEQTNSQRDMDSGLSNSQAQQNWKSNCITRLITMPSMDILTHRKTSVGQQRHRSMFPCGPRLVSP
jgi:hypothetical protein